MILVTATTPTVSGEGKTVTSIGLTQGLAHIGKRAVITSREPSLGPVFGMKGGAAGGGLSQIEPAAKINLHFHGDFHAISSANNLLAALIDAHLFHGNELNLDPNQITWPRAMDMNDRALRRIQIDVGGKRDGANRKTNFVITAASEIMAILALAENRKDLRQRLESIVIGMTRGGKPVRAGELHAVGGMMALLSEAILPNLAQTSDGTPAFVHTGPFANIAHGTSSVVSQKMALRLADYVVNEAGFAADLGAEKFLDIVMQQSGTKPAIAVVVTTVQSIRTQGGGDLAKGLPNLGKHIDNMKSYGLPTIVAVNRFPQDSDADLKYLADYSAEHGAKAALSEGFTKGGPGAKDLGGVSGASDGGQSGAGGDGGVRLVGLAGGKNSEGRDENLWCGEREFYGSGRIEACAIFAVGLCEVAGVHCEDAVQFQRRSENSRRSDRLDSAHFRRGAFGGSEVRRDNFRQHGVDAGPAETIARSVDRYGRRRRNLRRLIFNLQALLLDGAFLLACLAIPRLRKKPAIWKAIAVTVSVDFCRFGFFDPFVEDAGEVGRQFVEGEAHSLFRLDARDGAVGFEHFVFGVNFDHDRSSFGKRIADLDEAAAEAEIADLG